MKLLHEDSRFKISWDILICAIALTTGLVLPLELLQGFSYGHKLTPWWTAFSLIGLIDSALTFHTSFERGGVIVTDRRAIRRRYLRSWFWLDLAANLPFVLINGLQMHGNVVSMLPLLRLPQLFRITTRLSPPGEADRDPERRQFPVALALFRDAARPSAPAGST